MHSFERAVRRAYEIYNNKEHYCYLYGAKGVKLTRSVLQYFVTKSPSYFSKWSADDFEKYLKENEGKIAVDCSGFVSLCFDWLPKRSSINYFNHSAGEFNSFVDSVGGAMLYTTHHGAGRHIGIDVGSGFFIDAASEETGIRMCRFRDAPEYWEYCFKAEDTDYEGATASCIYNI